jgi:phage pi2 protein 07
VAKYLNVELKEDKYFVNKVETQLREKSLRGSQTQDIQYLEDKASYKTVVLTSPDAVVVTLNSDTYLYVNASQPSLLP